MGEPPALKKRKFDPSKQYRVHLFIFSFFIFLLVILVHLHPDPVEADLNLDQHSFICRSYSHLPGIVTRGGL